MATDILQTLAAEFAIPIWVIVVASLWSLAWKALAMWKSARLNQPAWFIVLLVFNTLGILDILYIFLFSKIKFSNKTKAKKKRKK